MANTYWVYFLTREELVDTYKRAGGKRGTHNKDNPTDNTIAAHALYLYLMPAKIQVWLATLDEARGIALIVGNANDTFGQAMYRSLAELCHNVFGCPPDQWSDVGGTDPMTFTREQDGKTHTMKLLLLRESERCPRDYPAEDM